MTRFARAKGSKSSNERAPEDSTPWEVMKEQLMQSKKDSEDSKKRELAEKQRIVNYENFLKEHKTQKRKATWCDFPETQVSILGAPNQTSQPEKKKTKKQSTPLEQSQTTTDQDASNKHQSKNKSQKKKSKNSSSSMDTEVQDTEIKDNTLNNESKKVKKNKKQNNKPTTDSEVQQNATAAGQIESKGKKNKKQKVVEGKSEIENNHQNNKIHNDNQNKPPKQKKKKKLVNGEPVRRKPVNDNSFQLIINGKEVELVRFDGFPIMKKDAERLQELKTNMIKKGIPKSEVQRTMKLERRRAEKALARVKRDVCYNCRKGGHNLSDCPELKTKIPGVGAPDGLCFKCGSTEHRQFECKVQRDKEFRFATCFICKEPGHIARQCPDNPKGLYPNGGSCKLCGDVTHLRKDCPTVQDKREDSSIKLQTLDSADLEAIPQKSKSTGGEEPPKKPKKITF